MSARLVEKPLGHKDAGDYAVIDDRVNGGSDGRGIYAHPVKVPLNRSRSEPGLFVELTPVGHSDDGGLCRRIVDCVANPPIANPNSPYSFLSPNSDCARRTRVVGQVGDRGDDPILDLPV